MNTLLLDTSTNVLSIALSTDSSYEERLINGNFSHSEDLLSEIKSLLGRAGLEIKDLGLLIVTKGPGSFTGLRVGMASMKGFSSALSIPLVSVPTLDAIREAVSVYDKAVVSVIDAKKKRFYISMHYGEEKIIEDRDGNPEDVIDEMRKYPEVLITGPDAKAFAEKVLAIDPSLNAIVDADAPRNLSKAILRLGERKYRQQGADDIGEGPVYIRRSDAEEALLRRIKEESHGM